MDVNSQVLFIRVIGDRAVDKLVSITSLENRPFSTYFNLVVFLAQYSINKYSKARMACGQSNRLTQLSMKYLTREELVRYFFTNHKQMLCCNLSTVSKMYSRETYTYISVSCSTSQIAKYFLQSRYVPTKEQVRKRIVHAQRIFFHKP